MAPKRVNVANADKAQETQELKAAPLATAQGRWPDRDEACGPDDSLPATPVPCISSAFRSLRSRDILVCGEDMLKYKSIVSTSHSRTVQTN